MTNERNLRNEEIPELQVMVDRNLVKWALAESHSSFEYGCNWYPIEKENVKAAFDLAVDGICTLDQMCDVVGIVSPGRRWSDNIKDGAATCIAWSLPTLEERIHVLNQFRVSRRYGLPAFQRAWSYLDGVYVLGPRTAPKTWSFGDNLKKLFASLLVTFDQHNCHIVLGEDDVFGSIGVSPTQYFKLNRSIYIAADLVGVHPMMFQSAIWHDRVTSVQESGE